MKPKRSFIVGLLLSPLAIVGCGSSTPSNQPAPATQAADKTYPPAPAGTPFAKVSVGMDMKQVTDLIGPPTDSSVYITGKAFVPFYFGGDTHRTQFMYKGQGRIIFSPNSQFTSGQSVIEIEYDPTETGYNH